MCALRPEAKTALIEPRVCGLLAERPSGLSQAMHNAAFLKLGLPYFYVNFQTVDTESAIDVMRKLGIRGFSLTIPHKEVALKHVDKLSAEARAIGAINTAINDGTEIRGENTDWHGIVAALEESGFTGAGKRAFIVGAGGASRAAIYALKEKLGLKDILVSGKTLTRAEDLAREFGVIVADYAKLSQDVLSGVQLIINATPIGSSSGSANYPFNLSDLNSRHYLFDMVTRDTPLTQHGVKIGAKVIPGSRMLLHQALKQFELFTEEKAPRDVMENALREALARQS